MTWRRVEERVESADTNLVLAALSIPLMLSAAVFVVLAAIEWRRLPSGNLMHAVTDLAERHHGDECEVWRYPAKPVRHWTDGLGFEST